MPESPIYPFPPGFTPKGLISIFPSLAAICLDRRLSDHRPILLRESSVDYGPTPFRVFHSWFTKDGFDNLIADTWNNLSIMETNKISLLRKKFQALKAIIKNWSRDEMLKASAVRHSAQSRISELDKLIDKGLSNNDIINERISLLKDIHDLDKRHSSDLAQKAKIQWVIEGDENSKYFHGIINKKRSQLAIRGVLVDGEWIEDPPKVKNEFLEHFSNRFSMPTGQTINLDSHMFQKISIDQNGGDRSGCLFRKKLRRRFGSVALINLQGRMVFPLNLFKNIGTSFSMMWLMLSRNFSLLVKFMGIGYLIKKKWMSAANVIGWNTFSSLLTIGLLSRLLANGGALDKPGSSLSPLPLDFIVPVNAGIWFRQRWIWSLDSSGEFSIKSTRLFIDDHLLLAVGAPTRWVSEVPIKINIMAWKVSLDKLPTRLNLSLRGIEIPSITCPICSCAGESCSHLFFSCSMARNITTKLARWWEFDYPDLFSYDDWLEWFHTLRLLKGFKDILEGVFYVMWWVIWKYRNQTLFGSSQPRMDMLFDEIVLLSFTWCSNRCKNNFDWISWMKCPRSLSL
ncbi:RNA-directed DNA polymerase, eukaryota [Tanacetum coccineum]